MSLPRLIVGLGNPGPEYAETRHNAGAWYVERLAQSFGISLSPDSKFFGFTGRGTIAGHDVRLLIPTTFMNASGKAVAAMANFFKYSTDDIMVAFDELDLSPGVMKLKVGGSSTQNGIRDIVSSLGNNKQFLRLRLGIGHPGHKGKVLGHVLGRPGKQDKDHIHQAIELAVKHTPLLLDEGLLAAQTILHAHKPTN